MIPPSLSRYLWLALLLSVAHLAWADITSNLTLWYRFDDGSGTSPVDSSGNGRTGTMVGTPLPTWLASGSCKIGGCLTFAGTTDPSAVTLGANVVTALLTTTAGTMAAWVNPHGAAPDGTTVFALPKVMGDNAKYLSITRGTINGLNDSIWMYNWDTDEDRIGVPYTIDTWVHVVWVHGGGMLTAYKNGVLASPVVSTCANANPCASGTTGGGTLLEIGLRDAGSVRADIDEVRMYNRALTATDVQELFAYDGVVFGNRWRMMKWMTILTTVYAWLWPGGVRFASTPR
jgi:large repetitive protein